MKLELILRDAGLYRERVQVRCNAHFHMCRKYQRRHNMVGIPAVIFGTIVSTTIFSRLAENAKDSPLLWFTGAFALAAVVLSALQTFFNFSAVSAQHKQAAVKFEAIRHDLDNLIRSLLIDPPAQDDIKEVLKALYDITAGINQVSQEAPSIRSGVLAKAAEGLKEAPLLDFSAAGAAAESADLPEGARRSAPIAG